MSVDRYTSECSKLCHFPDDQGKWVYYDDYQLLESRVRELEAANDDFRNRLKPSYDYMDGQAVSVAEDEIDRLRAALQRIIDFGDAEYKVMWAKQALEVKP